MTQPISPDQAERDHVPDLPDWAIQVWNHLIRMNYKHRRAVVMETEAENQLEMDRPADDDTPLDDLTKIDFHYKNAGWKVSYKEDPARFVFEYQEEVVSDDAD